MSVVTKSVVITSVAAQVAASSFSTTGTSLSAAFGNPVPVYIGNRSIRIWLGGSSAVTSASGYLLTSATSTSINLRQGEELWAITSAAVNSTCTFMFLNQPV
jgi:hypothetical protein